MKGRAVRQPVVALMPPVGSLPSAIHALMMPGMGAHRGWIRRLFWGLALTVMLPTPAEALQYYRCNKHGRSFVQTTPCHAGADAAARSGASSASGGQRDRQQPAARALGQAWASAAPREAPAGQGVKRWPWSGLKRGMGLAAVSRQVKDVEQKAGGYLINGAQALLVKQDIEFAGDRYRADYYFLDYGYQQVSLRKADGQPRDNEAVRAEFARLAQALTKVLGRPSRQQPIVQNHFSLSGGMEWDLPGNDKAWLSIVPVSRSTSHLTFGYRPDSEWKLPRP